MPNQDQKDYWNASAGEKWAAEQAHLDAMLAPVTALLMDAVAPRASERLLDIGCGTGETSLLAADVGAQVTGVDISQPMLDLAASRLADRGDMQLADAATWQADAAFDVIMSRFGVMFFDDPQAAFTNIGTNLKPGGRLAFACWQAPKNNSWVLTPMMAIKPFLPEAPAPDPHAPGPFAFADPERLHGILAGAGFADISIAAHDVPITLALEGGVEQAVQFSTQIGPAARAMAEVDANTKVAMHAALTDALQPHEKDGQVVLGGGIFIVTAVREG